MLKLMRSGKEEKKKDISMIASPKSASLSLSLLHPYIVMKGNGIKV